jgi:hypothetical protein
MKGMKDKGETIVLRKKVFTSHRKGVSHDRISDQTNNRMWNCAHGKATPIRLATNKGFVRTDRDHMAAKVRTKRPF